MADGERDALAMPHHAIALSTATAEAGKRRVTLRIFRDLAHLFTRASADESRGEKAGEVSREFPDALQDWAAAALAKK